MALDPLLVEILVCPQDKEGLWYLEDEDALVNLRLRRRYPVRDGIPVLLVGESEELEDAEFARISAKVEHSGVLTGTPRPAAGGEPPSSS